MDERLKASPAPTPPASGAPGELVTAREAAKLLGIKLDTLYAYVSRGLVRSVSGEGRKARLYLKDDLDRLRARSDAHRGHAPVAAGALRWGEPVLDSAITAIDEIGRAHV